MDKRTEICEYLKKNHVGKERAVYSRELQRLFSIDGRNLRRKINRLRQSGVPICSGETGYYYADNEQEINDTIFWLNELETKVSRAKNGLSRSIAKNGQTVVLEITIRVKED